MSRIYIIVAILLSVFSYAQTGSKNFTLTENQFIANPERQKFQTHLQGLSVYDIHYHSFDNTLVKGFLIQPKDTKKKYPVIIYNRGGNAAFGMVQDSFIMMFLSKIAAQGYIIIGSQLRGSEGSEGNDEFGGKDVNDVLYLFKIIGELKNADTNKIAQIGWSRGGVTNFQVLKKTDRIKTTITIAGPGDLMQSREKMFEVYKERIPGYQKDSVAVLKQRSPLFQLDSIKNKKASLLFIQGDKDIHVAPENSKQLYAKAQALDIKSNLVVYPGEDHSLKDVWPDLIDRIHKWLTTELVNKE